MRALRLSSVFVLASLTAVAAYGCGGATDKGGTTPVDDTGSTSSDDTGTAGDETGGDDSGTGDDSSVVGDSATGSDTGTTTDTAPIDVIDVGDGGQIIAGCGLDSDGDGITDAIEGRPAKLDTDGDGIDDYLDPDSDDDTIPDKVEWIAQGCATSPFADKNDADGDGIPNFQDTDSDDNGLDDRAEACPPKVMPGAPPGCTGAAPSDFDGDGDGDWVDLDNDHDSSSTDKHQGLLDKFETTNSAGAYVGLIDTDGDKVFDLYDRDSDGDFVLDQDDGIGDPDSDTKRNFQDLDSDGDSVGDTCEARDNPAASVADINKPLLDTDKDGSPDYLDRDTDADLLGDGAEDKNGNCIVDANETSRVLADTDGDGIGDFIEVNVVSEACANNKACTPANQGVFYFIEPYSADGSLPPSPTSSPLALSTTLNKGDVGFVVDTTYSMSGEIAGLKTSLNSIISSLAAKIPDLGVGVAGHDDLPNGANGTCVAEPSFGILVPDRPFYLPGGYIVDVSSGGTPTGGVATAQNAVNGLALGDGYDIPESQAPALVHAIRGDAFSWPAANGCAAGSITTDNGPGAGSTTFGGLGFRKASYPILIEVSDAPWHDGTRPTGGEHDVYGSSEPASTDLVTAIKAANASFIGVACATSVGESDATLRDATSTNSSYGDMAYVTDNTGSFVPPSAFGGSCKTGIGGASLAADHPGDGACRLIFSCNHDGTGIGPTIVDAVAAVLASVKFNVHVQAAPQAGESVDAVNEFVGMIQPSPTGGTDPVTGDTCVTFSAAQLADNFHTPKALPGAGDIQETINGLNPGPKYCFNVVPKANTTVAATTSTQTYHATLNVLALNGTTTLTLGAPRQVTFVVPPVANF